MHGHCKKNRRGFLVESARCLAAGLLAGAGLGRRQCASASEGLPALGGEQQAAHQRVYRVGIYTRPWDQFDYRVALDAIAEAGFCHAGLMTTTLPDRRLVITWQLAAEEAQHVGEEARKRGLSIPSVYGGDIPVAESLEAGIAALRRLIDNCVAAGARTLLMAGVGNQDLYERYFKAIAECCDYAAEKHLPITIKPHGGLNATGPQCRKCVELVGHRNFSVWYDPGNIFFYSDGKLDPVEDASAVDSLVREGMCIKDFKMQTSEGKPQKDVWVTPGQGQVDFAAVLARLKRGGFSSGDLVIECVNRPEPGNLRALAAEARKAREFVEQLATELAK